MVELMQKILTSLLKLSDRDTHQIAIEDLQTTIQNLSPEALPMLLNSLYDAVSSDLKPSAHKDSLCLLAFTCAAHPNSSSAHLTKIIGHVIKRLKDSDSAMARICAKEEVFYKIMSNWRLEQKFNCRLVFWDKW